MQRDMELVREILFAVEERRDLRSLPVEIEGCSYQEVNYHIQLLVEAGLVEGRTYSGGYWRVSRLTWDGHEFLDNARDNTVWCRAMALVREKGVSVSFEILTALLINLAKSSFDLDASA